MDQILSLLVGPYGKALALMDEYQFLPSQEHFTEFSEEMYEAYYNKKGMPEERLYHLRPGNSKDCNDIFTVSKTEMEEILEASEFIKATMAESPEMEKASDSEKLADFKSQFPFLFPEKN